MRANAERYRGFRLFSRVQEGGSLRARALWRWQHQFLMPRLFFADYGTPVFELRITSVHRAELEVGPS